MSLGSITGLAPAIITYATGDFHSLTVKTGISGGNVVNILSASETTSVIGNAPHRRPRRQHQHRQCRQRLGNIFGT